MCKIQPNCRQLLRKGNRPWFSEKINCWPRLPPGNLLGRPLNKKLSDCSPSSPLSKCVIASQTSDQALASQPASSPGWLEVIQQTTTLQPSVRASEPWQQTLVDLAEPRFHVLQNSLNFVRSKLVVDKAGVGWGNARGGAGAETKKGCVGE